MDVKNKINKLKIHRVSMKKEQLSIQLREGLSYMKIALIEGVSPKKVEYWVNKFNIKYLSKFNREYMKDVDPLFFNKLDTKEKSYIVGFILGDGYISEKLDVSLGLAIKDRKLIEDIDKYIPWECKINYDMTFNKKTRRFPRVRYGFRSRKMGQHLLKMYGKRLASERHTPIVPKHYQKYLIAGFFDADGCVTWGYRKDRGRLWHKISFTASESILIGVQKILLRYDISSIIRPKKDENVSIIEFSNKKDIKKFYNLLPQDGIRLDRKLEKLNKLIVEINK